MTWRLELTQECYLMVGGVELQKQYLGNLPFTQSPLTLYEAFVLSFWIGYPLYHDTCNISMVYCRTYQSSNVFNRSYSRIPHHPDFHFMAEIFEVCLKRFGEQWAIQTTSRKKNWTSVAQNSITYRDIPLADILSQWPWWPCNFSRLICYQNPPKDAVFVISLPRTLFLLANPGERNFVNDTTEQFLKEKHFNAKQMLEWQTRNPNQWCV